MIIDILQKCFDSKLYQLYVSCGRFRRIPEDSEFTRQILYINEIKLPLMDTLEEPYRAVYA